MQSQIISNQMPFGLKIGPGTFQRTMDIILSHVERPFKRNYLDDIVIFSKFLDEQVNHVRQFLSLLTDNRRCSKCEEG